jgi:hypothetical protein
MLQAGRSRVRLLMGFVNFVFSAPNPFSHTVALGFTQTVTEMSTGRFQGVKRGHHIRLPSVSRMSRQYGILDISQPHMRPWPVTEIALLYGDVVCFL